MQIVFTGVKQVGGYCALTDGESDFQKYRTLLDELAVPYKTWEFGDDYVTAHAIEILNSAFAESIITPD